jgi:hypothetical protein
VKGNYKFSGAISDKEYEKRCRDARYYVTVFIKDGGGDVVFSETVENDEKLMVSNLAINELVDLKKTL